MKRKREDGRRELSFRFSQRGLAVIGIDRFERPPPPPSLRLPRSVTRIIEIWW